MQAGTQGDEVGGRGEDIGGNQSFNGSGLNVHILCYPKWNRPFCKLNFAKMKFLDRKTSWLSWLTGCWPKPKEKQSKVQ